MENSLTYSTYKYMLVDQMHLRAKTSKDNCKLGQKHPWVQLLLRTFAPEDSCTHGHLHQWTFAPKYICTHGHLHPWTFALKDICTHFNSFLLSKSIRRLLTPAIWSPPPGSCLQTRSAWGPPSSTSPAPPPPRSTRPGWSTPSQSWR